MVSTLFRVLVTLVILLFALHQGFLFWRIAIDNGLIYTAGLGAILVVAWPILLVVLTLCLLVWVWKIK